GRKGRNRGHQYSAIRGRPNSPGLRGRGTLRALRVCGVAPVRAAATTFAGRLADDFEATFVGTGRARGGFPSTIRAVTFSVASRTAERSVARKDEGHICQTSPPASPLKITTPAPIAKRRLIFDQRDAPTCGPAIMDASSFWRRYRSSSASISCRRSSSWVSRWWRRSRSGRGCGSVMGAPDVRPCENRSRPFLFLHAGDERPDPRDVHLLDRDRPKLGLGEERRQIEIRFEADVYDEW